MTEPIKGTESSDRRSPLAPIVTRLMGQPLNPLPKHKNWVLIDGNYLVEYDQLIKEREREARIDALKNLSVKGMDTGLVTLGEIDAVINELNKGEE